MWKEGDSLARTVVPVELNSGPWNLLELQWVIVVAAWHALLERDLGKISFLAYVHTKTIP